MSDRVREDHVRELAIRYGVPANVVSFAPSGAKAAEIAAEIGRSVAIKLVADDVVHKSKAGGVVLDVGPDEVEAVTEQLFAAQRERGVKVRGVTVEAMVDRGMELVVGAVHSPSFGHVVMFGSGGVDIETVQDVAFGLAPLTVEDATRLIDRTIAGKIVTRRYPGRVPDLVDLLMAVAGPEGMLFEAAVTEIDLNPVIVSDDRVVAVDARAKALPEPVAAIRLPDPAAAYEQLRPALYPHSIAVVGASADPSKMGHRVVRNLVDFGYSGKLYPISAKTAEICGVSTVPGIEHLPGDVDRAVVALPAAAVPRALEDLAEVGVHTAHVYTADTPPLDPGILERGLRVIGPNCIGHYSPHVSVTMIAAQASGTGKGRVAFVSQSGTYAGDAVRRGKELGLEFSFASSVGNCEDVNPAELLAFCAADDNTDVIAFYLESDRAAGEFFRLARTIDKPVVLLKGGRTLVGGEAAASHTGAMAGDPQLLVDAATQAGVLLVDDLDHLLDTLLVLQSGERVMGDGLALIGSGGGVAVVGADGADAWDLRLPDLSSATAAELAGFAAPGSSLDNPIDIPIWSLFTGNQAHTGSIVSAVANDRAVDALCVFLDLGTVFDMHSGAAGEAIVDLLAGDLLTAERHGKPIVVVWRSGFSSREDDVLRRLRRDFAAQGIPVVDSVDRAVAAIGGSRWLTRQRASRDGA